MPIRGIPCDNFTASNEACEKNPRPVHQDMSLSELAAQILEAAKCNHDAACNTYGTMFGCFDTPPKKETDITCLRSHLYTILDVIARANDILYKINSQM
jgi:hypothetical protein